MQERPSKEDISVVGNGLPLEELSIVAFVSENASGVERWRPKIVPLRKNKSAIMPAWLRFGTATTATATAAVEPTAEDVAGGLLGAVGADCGRGCW